MGVELSEFDLTYRPRTTIKGQALAYFITEVHFSDCEEEGERWSIFVDGSCCDARSGTRLVLEGPNGENYELGINFCFETTNNEYEALIMALDLALLKGARRVPCFTDS